MKKRGCGFVMFRLLALVLGDAVREMSWLKMWGIAAMGIVFVCYGLGFDNLADKVLLGAFFQRPPKAPNLDDGHSEEPLI